jgi:hypothetical protein
VVLRPEENVVSGHAVARALMARLGIDEAQLIPQAYVDLVA